MGKVTADDLTFATPSGWELRKRYLTAKPQEQASMVFGILVQLLADVEALKKDVDHLYVRN